jgi:hypothetical protein
MKKNVLVVSLFLFISLFSHDISTIKDDQITLNHGQGYMLSRLNYGTYLEFLPQTLALANTATEQNLEEFDVYDWIIEDEDWYQHYAYSFNYFYNGELTQYITVVIIPGQVYEITTDFTWVNGLLTESLNTTTFMEDILDVNREYYYYTNDNIFEGCLKQEYFLNEWRNSERWTSTITNGRISMMNIDEYNNDLMDWQPIIQYTYTWDEELITSQKKELFAGGDWVNSQQNIYTYNEDALLETDLEQSWIEGQWNDENMTTYSYEANLPTYNLKQAWTGAEWSNSLEEFTTYDFEDRPELIHRNEMNGGNWINDRETYYYYTVDTSQNSIITAPVSIWAYPNPFNPSTTLSWQVNGTILPEKMDIFDLRGKKVNELVSCQCCRDGF